jgi:nucleotide-binding universal stress UspA family protein
VLAALDPGRNHSKPEGLDGKILEFAEAFSRALQGHMHAMHAFPVPVAYLEASAGVSGSVAAELQAMDAGRAQAALDALLMNIHIPSEHRHILPGPPADAIVRQATELNASIVVMGSIARSGVSGLFIGNTAEKILTRLPCDLLLLKPDEFRDAIVDQRRGARMISTGMYF